MPGLFVALVRLPFKRKSEKNDKYEDRVDDGHLFQGAFRECSGSDRPQHRIFFEQAF